MVEQTSKLHSNGAVYFWHWNENRQTKLEPSFWSFDWFCEHSESFDWFCEHSESFDWFCEHSRSFDWFCEHSRSFDWFCEHSKSFDWFCEHSANARAIWLDLGTCSFDVVFWLWFVGRRRFCKQVTKLVSTDGEWNKSFVTGPSKQFAVFIFPGTDHCTVSVAILDVEQSRQKLQQTYGKFFNFRPL